MITLYHCPNSRSNTAMYLLEELGQPYEVKVIDVRAGEGQTPEYLAINPMGKVPAIRDGADVVSEIPSRRRARGPRPALRTPRSTPCAARRRAERPAPR
ncbi:MAG TPA: glutathione S-transferase N-terminal domain-containing protein [Caulobacteraceae bacterium]|nr:glutathione S-transferase N-terminal domain-containing protein [Caulobacteraceae bacterium]